MNESIKEMAMHLRYATHEAEKDTGYSFRFHLLGFMGCVSFILQDQHARLMRMEVAEANRRRGQP